MDNEQKTTPEYPVTYWVHPDPDQKIMMLRFSPTQADFLVVFGRDLTKPFDHRHTRVTYPSEARLDEAIAKLVPGSPQGWNDLMNEYLQVNKVKLEIMNVYRQAQYDKGTLR
jgi:hypothetical protein